MSADRRPPKPHPEALWTNGRWFLPDTSRRNMVRFAARAALVAFTRRWDGEPPSRSPQDHQRAVAVAGTRLRARKATFAELVAKLEEDPDDE